MEKITSILPLLVQAQATNSPQQSPVHKRAEWPAPDELVDDAMAWLVARHPVQLSRLDAATRGALLEGYRMVLCEMSPGEISRARRVSEDGMHSYVPDPAEFRRRGLRQDAEEQFHAAARAAGCVPAAWHSLSPRTFAAAQSMARSGWSLRESDWTRPGMQAAWQACYRASCRAEDAGEQLPAPPLQAPAIPQKTDLAAFRAARGGIYAALGLAPPDRPFS